MKPCYKLSCVSKIFSILNTQTSLCIAIQQDCLTYLSLYSTRKQGSSLWQRWVWPVVKKLQTCTCLFLIISFSFVVAPNKAWEIEWVKKLKIDKLCLLTLIVFKKPNYLLSFCCIDGCRFIPNCMLYSQNWGILPWQLFHVCMFVF